MFASVTLRGLIHLLPLVVIVFVVMRLMAKRPDTEFGRWRPASERYTRR